ncbi:histidine phosphatase superfamily [Zopfochytrium polystomum]|nr:histidine phosphatase superfamily [Zopfochytrium polystomum]
MLVLSILLLGAVAAARAPGAEAAEAAAADAVAWVAPNATSVNNLTQVLSGAGYSKRLVFNSSTSPDYGVYDYCNMPHVRATPDPSPEQEYELIYVELTHRHHKRTPYQSNTFPNEDLAGEWCISSIAVNVVRRSKLRSTAIDLISYHYLNENVKSSCAYPMITIQGLADAKQHGADLFGVYSTKLGFLPTRYNASQVVFRVTSNPITTQTANAIISGMFPDATNVSLFLEVSLTTSLQPNYPCSYANDVKNAYQSVPAWTNHLNAPETIALYARLDGITGVDPTSSAWHSWFDHYFDNLSSRECHQIPLPCKSSNAINCVASSDADSVFRIGQYEYSYIYRDASQSLEFARTSYGLWFSELASNIRAAVNRTSPVLYRHNVAHDGSISRMLAFLQAGEMVWPGMGAEIVFEVYRHKSTGDAAVRVLWGGRVMFSSYFGEIDMVPVDDLLSYIDALTGVSASYVIQKCGLAPAVTTTTTTTTSTSAAATPTGMRAVLNITTNWCDGSTYNVVIQNVGGSCATNAEVFSSFAAKAWGGQNCWGLSGNQFYCSTRNGCPTSFSEFAVC